jgi:hypothetical protein
MWRIELTTKTATPDARTGIQRVPKAIEGMGTSSL